jgi:branched-chain amino acid transport system ATP-binding protein
MVALARGIITDPKVLLLDEPSLGLAPKIVKEVFIKIREINERHKTCENGPSVSIIHILI